MRAHWLMVAFSFVPLFAFGYGITTHTELSAEAISTSNLGGPAPLKDWGIDGKAGDVTFPRSTDRQPISISDLISTVGVVDEDNFPRPSALRASGVGSRAPSADDTQRVK